MSIRKQLEKGIQAGRTVTYRGVFYSSIADLPSEAELAKGDKAQEEAARLSIEQEMARLKAELAKLEKPATDKPVVDSVVPAAGTISTETPEGKAALDKLEELGEGQNAELRSTAPEAAKTNEVEEAPKGKKDKKDEK